MVAQACQSISSGFLHFTVHDAQPWFCYATIKIPSAYVDRLYQQAIINQRVSVIAYGFAKHNAPLEYIAEHYKPSLINHLKEFLLKYIVINFLYDQIRLHKILVSGEPRLTDVYVEPHQDACYRFELSLFPVFQLQEWKYFPFKAPKRKNYKDLDRQVESFLSEEHNNQERYINQAIKIGDWVYFELTFLVVS